MQGRLEAIRGVGRKRRLPEAGQIRHAVQFGMRSFHVRTMEQALPKRVVQNIVAARAGKERFDPLHADAVAEGLKTWAIQHGATHFTHWFQPLTGGIAEKHDSFFAFDRTGAPLEQFQGKHLLKGESDASSLPHGGLRSTHSARGYTAWDPLSDPFLWEAGDGMTLCIPSLYFSWAGESLDHKIPLLRSEEKLSLAVARLLTLAGLAPSKALPTVGAEQEYFVLDQHLHALRPDLLLCGRTVLGAPSPKGQQLQDHYFGAVGDRVLAFMREFEDFAIQLGIPVRTRHNEVAPAQYEVAPLFERSSLAADHNLLLMQVMRHVAHQHGLVCLFHEKPFAAVNGSGKHCNWSLATESGLNLLDPQGNRFLFLTLLTAIIRALWEHAALLRESIASAENDLRLGGCEAPSAIPSVYLGQALEQIVEQIIHSRQTPSLASQLDLGLSHVPLIEVDPSDRNRTAFVAFAGNKFEFRAVGASSNIAFPISVINAIVSDSLHLIVDEIADRLKDQTGLSEEQLLDRSLPVFKKHLQLASPILFNGDSYSAEWEQEAARRGLPVLRSAPAAFPYLLDKKSIRAFEGILTEPELQCRHAIAFERYTKVVLIELHLMIELFQTQILPAAQRDLAQRTAHVDWLGPEQQQRLQTLSSLIDRAILAFSELEALPPQIADFGWEAKAKALSEIGMPKMHAMRQLVDLLETQVDNVLWPLPKMRELLFFV